MKKIILYPIVSLLLVSSCNSSKVTLERNLKPTIKVVNQDEIKMKTINLNHPIFNDPYWALSIKKRGYNMTDLFYTNN